MSVNSKMTAIADKIRTLLGITGKMGMDTMATSLGNAVTEVDSQAALIQQIKTALEGKAGGGGGTVLPTLTNPGSAADLAEGKQLIGADGSVVEGNLKTAVSFVVGESTVYADGEYLSIEANPYFMDGNTLEKAIVTPDTVVINTLVLSSEVFGNALPEHVAQGVTFTSENGLKITGTGSGGGMVVKSGTTTNRAINTGLSDIEQFFIYKESQTGTGLIHLHYTKSATSRMYASAWSTQNYGSKTITNGTGGVTVSGGTLTISATQATQGALTSNVTYKWVAIGKE